MSRQHITISNSQQAARHARGRAASASVATLRRVARKDSRALPCPFCQQQPDTISIENGSGIRHMIKCVEVECPASFVNVSTFNDESYEQILARWNSRDGKFKAYRGTDILIERGESKSITDDGGIEP